MNKITYITFLLFIQQAMGSIAHPVIEKLDNRIAQKDTIVCCGLDPDLSKMPSEIINDSQHTDEEKTELFLKTVVDCTADTICAYKIQKAFFDQFSQGSVLLHNVIQYIQINHPDIPIFLDCKIGDTGNTMQAYLHTFFEKYGVDGILVNPYMGDDIFEELAQYPDKVGIVLVQTSNPGATIVQNNIVADGKPLWQFILDLVLHRWNKYNNLIPVLSSTTDGDGWHTIRKQIPNDTPILFAGVGAQGGDPSGLIQLLNNNGRGVFINSSRDLLYPYKPEQSDWRECIRNRTLRFKEQLNSYRIEASTTKFLLLLGPSGVGKSTIINYLKQLDERFKYISPYITRPLRPGEQDKIQISKEEMDKLQDTGQLLSINVLYNDIRYGTPRYPIEHALHNNNFPVLDWPISKIDLMKKEFPDKLLCIYIEPPDIETLKQRLNIDQRDKDGKRFKQAHDELTLLQQGAFDSVIDLRITNGNDCALELAQTIYRAYCNSIADH